MPPKVKAPPNTRAPSTQRAASVKPAATPQASTSSPIPEPVQSTSNKTNSQAQYVVIDSDDDDDTHRPQSSQPPPRGLQSGQVIDLTLSDSDDEAPPPPRRPSPPRLVSLDKGKRKATSPLPSYSRNSNGYTYETRTGDDGTYHQSLKRARLDDGVNGTRSPSLPGPIRPLPSLASPASTSSDGQRTISRGGLSNGTPTAPSGSIQSSSYPALLPSIMQSERNKTENSSAYYSPPSPASLSYPPSINRQYQYSDRRPSLASSSGGSAHDNHPYSGPDLRQTSQRNPSTHTNAPYRRSEYDEHNRDSCRYHVDSPPYNNYAYSAPYDYEPTDQRPSVFADDREWGASRRSTYDEDRRSAGGGSGGSGRY